MNALRGAVLAGWMCLALVSAAAVRAETTPARGLIDGRIRSAVYNADEVYRLRGIVGYQIDIQFESGEEFIGLGAGDIEALSFTGQSNHLFLKPKAANVSTNLTVLTNRRQYLFDYLVSAARPSGGDAEVIFALRFSYPATRTANGAGGNARIDAEFHAAEGIRPRNEDYWYCGHPSLMPVAASDDGVQTRLRFGAQAELPAVFVRNDDGSESLLNFHLQDGDVIVHRVARQFVLRRGSLSGCVLNKKFTGGGERLDSGTIAPDVRRATSDVAR